MKKFAFSAAACLLTACASTPIPETVEIAPAGTADTLNVENIAVVNVAPADAESEIVCRMEKTTGSRITTERCYTPEELAMAQRGSGNTQAFEEARDIQRRQQDMINSMRQQRADEIINRR